MATEMPPPPSAAPVAAPTAGFTRAQVGGALGVAGGVFCVLGAFLPWLTATAPLVGSLSRSGMDGGGDGILFLALGVALVGVGAWVASRRASKHAGMLLLLGALGGGALVWQEFQTVSERVTTATATSSLITASAGSGLYTIAAGLALAGLGALITERS